MEYEKFIEEVKTKVSIEEFERLNKQFVEETIARGVKPEDVNNQLMLRWNVYFRKQKFIDNMSKLTKVNVEGVILGVSTTDYGAQRIYDNALKSFNKDPEDAVNNELTNQEGQPLHQSGFNKGKVIEEIKLTYQYYGMFKLEGTENLVKGCLTSNDELTIIKDCIIKFEAGKDEKQSSDEWLSLRARRSTSFNVVKELSYNDMIDLFENHMQVMSVKEACEMSKSFFDAGEKNYNRLFVVKGAMGSDGINFLDEDKASSDVMSIIDQSISFDDVDTLPITIWLDKNNKLLPRNISADALDIFVIGVPTYGIRDDNPQVTMNALGLYVANNYLIEQDAIPINPDNEDVVDSSEEDFA